MTIPSEPFLVIGVATRTTNAEEGDPATARLPALWERAFRDPYLTDRRERYGADLVAVLTDYESDHSGAYTQVVGVRAAALTDPDDLPEGLVAVGVPARVRRHVPAPGPMPAALIAAWQGIWRQAAAGEIERGYGTDYEVHTAAGADIYLSTRET